MPACHYRGAARANDERWADDGLLARQRCRQSIAWIPFKRFIVAASAYPSSLSTCSFVFLISPRAGDRSKVAKRMERTYLSYLGTAPGLHGADELVAARSLMFILYLALSCTYGMDVRVTGRGMGIGMSMR